MTSLKFHLWSYRSSKVCISLLQHSQWLVRGSADHRIVLAVGTSARSIQSKRPPPQK